MKPNEDKKTGFGYKSVVRFADVDHAGIVYYPRYYHYFHVAFEEFFRERMGANAYLDLLDKKRIGFPAVASECEYKSPLRFNDSIETSIQLVKCGRSSIRLAYTVTHLESGVVAAKGLVTCVTTDLEAFSSMETPQSLRELFLELLPAKG